MKGPMERALESDLAATPPVPAGEVGELVERLRAFPSNGERSILCAKGYALLNEAAALLERHAAENARLREELEHFVDIVDGTDETGFDPHVEQMLMDTTEAARAALSSPSSLR